MHDGKKAPSELPLGVDQEFQLLDSLSLCRCWTEAQPHRNQRCYHVAVFLGYMQGGRWDLL